MAAQASTPSTRSSLVQNLALSTGARSPFNEQFGWLCTRYRFFLLTTSSNALRNGASSDHFQWKPPVNDIGLDAFLATVIV